MRIAINRFGPSRAGIIGTARWLSVCAIFLAAAALGGRLAAPTVVDFPDFPLGVAVVDLGQSLTINVDATNDGDQGVDWTCVGDACTKLTATSKWATFYASGITGTAIITATSVERRDAHRSLKVTVYLNAVPDMLCDSIPVAESSRSIVA
jgi:hypothetical protein